MIVADTNVILRGVRSPAGSSGHVLRGMIAGSIAFAASPALILEYEDVLKRRGKLDARYVSVGDIDVILDAICLRAVETTPWFSFRPFLADPKDDLVVDCALASGARIIVTDDQHFRHPALAAFGLRVHSAQSFVRLLLARKEER